MYHEKQDAQQGQKTKAFKDFASACWDLAKAFILIELAIVLAFGAYFGYTFVNKLTFEEPTNTTSITITKEDGTECILQTIEGKVFETCQE